MVNYRTLDELTAEYFTQHPEEIDAFLTEIFSDYAQDEDSTALLSAIRIPNLQAFLDMFEQLGHGFRLEIGMKLDLP